MVLQCFTGDKLLVEPNLVVGRSAREQVLARRLRERVYLIVQLRQLGNSGDEDITATSSATAQRHST